MESNTASTKPNTATAYLGLGSNLAGPQGEPLANLVFALSQLQQLPGCELLAVSPVVRSLALSLPGNDDAAPDFYNAVVKIATELPPLSLLAKTQGIELAAGRDHKAARWSARCLDIDLLLYGTGGNGGIVDTEAEGFQAVQHAQLSLPHPAMFERNFVLQPLLAITPELQVPPYGLLNALAAANDGQGLLSLPDAVRGYLQKWLQQEFSLGSATRSRDNASA